MTKREKTSFSVDPELWKRFQKAIIDRGAKSTEALDTALLMWLESVEGRLAQLSSVERELDINQNTRKWHQFLSTILNSDINQAKEAIQHNLKMFALTVEVMRARPSGGPKETRDEDERLTAAFRRFIELHPPDSPVRKAIASHFRGFMPAEPPEHAAESPRKERPKKSGSK